MERASIGGDWASCKYFVLLAHGHPVGATGVKQLIEIFRQMKGKCGFYQIRRGVALSICLIERR